MAELNLGKVKLTEAEMQELVRQYNGGFRFGTDENGNDGYFKFDEEAGADTFYPFKKGGGGDGAVSSPCIHKVKFTGVHAVTRATDLYSYFPISNVTRLVIKKLNFGIMKIESNASNRAILFYVYGKKKDETVQSIYSNSVNTSQAASSLALASKSVEDTEIDLSECESIEFIYLQIPKASGTNYTYYYTMDAEFELYF